MEPLASFFSHMTLMNFFLKLHNFKKFEKGHFVHLREITGNLGNDIPELISTKNPEIQKCHGPVSLFYMKYNVAQTICNNMCALLFIKLLLF